MSTCTAGSRPKAARAAEAGQAHRSAQDAQPPVIDSRSTVVYVSLQDSDELLAIDLATQAPRWKIKVGKLPADICT
jgi:YVTN family beta-propeller protein